MKQVLVLGSGQLGLMLAEAAARLGVGLDRLDLSTRELLRGTSPQRYELKPDWTACEYDFVTVEMEHFSDREFLDQLSRHPGFLVTRALDELADRRRQKALLDQLGINTAAWCVVNHTDDIAALQDTAGQSLIIKAARGGYDGRAQWRVDDGESDHLPADLMGQLIAERRVPFDREMSLVGARNALGEHAFYPLVENHHVDGMLRYTVAPAQAAAVMQSEAEQMLGKIMSALDYVGVMAMECFDEGGELLVNELAPRVHNSGHWTQDGASIDQFELHLRALCGFPLGQPEPRGFTTMLNLVGDEFDPSWLALDQAHMHWYGKSVRPGRKLGHVNVTATDVTGLARRLDSIRRTEQGKNFPDFEATTVMVSRL